MTRMLAWTLAAGIASLVGIAARPAQAEVPITTAVLKSADGGGGVHATAVRYPHQAAYTGFYAGTTYQTVNTNDPYYGYYSRPQYYGAWGYPYYPYRPSAYPNSGAYSYSVPYNYGTSYSYAPSYSFGFGW